MYLESTILQTCAHSCVTYGIAQLIHGLEGILLCELQTCNSEPRVFGPSIKTPCMIQIFTSIDAIYHYGFMYVALFEHSI